MKKLARYREILVNTQKCYQKMIDVLPTVANIMSDDTSTASLEAIRLITNMINVNLTPAKRYMHKLFTHIFVKDKDIRKEV